MHPTLSRPERRQPNSQRRSTTSHSGTPVRASRSLPRHSAVPSVRRRYSTAGLAGIERPPRPSGETTGRGWRGPGTARAGPYMIDGRVAPGANSLGDPPVEVHRDPERGSRRPAEKARLDRAQYYRAGARRPQTPARQGASRHVRVGCGHRARERNGFKLGFAPPRPSPASAGARQSSLDLERDRNLGRGSTPWSRGPSRRRAGSASIDEPSDAPGRHWMMAFAS